jgi:dTDP-4-amino-4,6-dideoxygalactose transaminase
MPSTTEAPLAIDGGEPVRSEPFPDRSLPPAASEADPVAALEAKFAAYLDLDEAEAVACRDGAAAYALALEELGITEGEAVIPALASAAVEAVRLAGLTVVPTEVEADSVNLGPRGLARALGDRTRVVIANHAFGHPFSAAELGRVLEPAGVPLIEDASAALGGAYRLQPTGLLGTLALFAFREPHLLSGEGAVLVTTDGAFASHLRDARDRAGASIADDAAQAAIGALRAADEELAIRRQLAWELTFDLRGRKGLSGMPHSRWVVHGYDRYVIRLRSLLWKRPIEESVAALQAEGIPCATALDTSLHLDTEVQAALVDDERLAYDGFPVARRLPEELITLPLYGSMTDLDIADITVALTKLEAAST